MIFTLFIQILGNICLDNGFVNLGRILTDVYGVNVSSDSTKSLHNFCGILKLSVF